jgi:putative transposase
MRKTYPTDLSDAEWFCIEPYLPTPKALGRPRVHSLREILNAIFYIARSGCAWRLLPHEFPPWKTIHHYFRAWRIDGTWEQLHTALFVIVCEYVLREILNQVQALWIASR